MRIDEYRARVEELNNLATYMPPHVVFTRLVELAERAVNPKNQGDGPQKQLGKLREKAHEVEAAFELPSATSRTRGGA